MSTIVEYNVGKANLRVEQLEQALGLTSRGEKYFNVREASKRILDLEGKLKAAGKPLPYVARPALFTDRLKAVAVKMAECVDQILGRGTSAKLIGEGNVTNVGSLVAMCEKLTEAPNAKLTGAAPVVKNSESLPARVTPAAAPVPTSPAQAVAKKIIADERQGQEAARRNARLEKLLSEAEKPSVLAARDAIADPLQRVKFVRANSCAIFRAERKLKLADYAPHEPPQPKRGPAVLASESWVAQLNAIKDPISRTLFYRANKTAIDAAAVAAETEQNLWH